MVTDDDDMDLLTSDGSSDSEQLQKILKLLREIGSQVEVLAEVPEQLNSLKVLVETSNEAVMDTISSKVPSSPPSVAPRRRAGSTFSTARIGSACSMASDSFIRCPSESCSATFLPMDSPPVISRGGSLRDSFTGSMILPHVVEEGCVPPHRLSMTAPRMRSKRSSGLESKRKDSLNTLNISEWDCSPDVWMTKVTSEHGAGAHLDNEVSKAVMSVSKISREHLDAEPERCMLLPGGRPALLWQVCILIVTTVIGTLVPLNFVYWSFPKFNSSSGLVFAYMVIDGFLLMDVLIRFRTAFKASHGKVVTDAHSVALRYLHTWFIPNLLAAWPTFLVPWFTSVTLALKLLRVMEVHILLSSLQDHMRHVRLTWLKVSLTVFLAAHSMACAWRAVQLGHSSEETDLGDWINHYIADMYWVVMTMTTVGYGVIPVTSTTARFFATICMFAGAVVFSFILSVVSSALKWLLDDDIGKTLTEVKGFMIFQRISPELQVRVERNIRDALATERKETMRPEIFSKLSQAMQCDLSLELLRGVILEFPLFTKQPRNFIAEIARAHVWVRALQGDVVVEEGQLVQELIFVVQGQIVVLEPCSIPSQKSCTQFQLEAGAWLGEACLFHENLVRDHSAVATQNSELAVIAAESYHKIKQNYPRIVSWHEALTQGLGAGDLRVQGLSYRAHLRWRSA